VDTILDDRSAYREAELSLAVLLVANVVDVSREALAAGREEHGAVHFVRAAPRHRVDEHPAEVALLHVERCEQHLVLAHGLEPDRLATRLPARLPGLAEPEQVVLARAVDLDVVDAIVDPPPERPGPASDTSADSTTKSVKFRLSDGRRRNAESEMTVAAPVRSGDRIGSVSVVTDTVLSMIV
jgi:hypothetical protein